MVKQRWKSDRGSATLVTGIISILFLCLCMGMAVDVAKNAYLKNSYQTMAQQAAEVAVKKVDARGSLRIQQDPLSPGTSYDALLQEYKNQKKSSYSTAVMAAGGHSDETTAYTSTGCSTRTITDWKGQRRAAQMPYIVIKYDTKRAYDNSSASSVVFVSEGGATPQLVAGSVMSGAKYSVVSAEVHDSSTNLMLNIFGINCQDYDSKVSAITFGSQEDLKENLSVP